MSLSMEQKFLDWLASAPAGEEFVYCEAQVPLVNRAAVQAMIARGMRISGEVKFCVRLGCRLGETLT